MAFALFIIPLLMETFLKVDEEVEYTVQGAARLLLPVVQLPAIQPNMMAAESTCREV
jgi:hypothetical protein